MEIESDAFGIEAYDEESYEPYGHLVDVYYSGTKSQWNKISGDKGQLQNATIHYAAVAPAQILSDPVDFAGTAGETATFTVEAAGGMLTYQWQYSDNGGKKWTDSSATTDTASCKIMQARDGRLYRCIVTDGNGDSVTSAAARIIYIASPVSIECSPANAVGEIGTVAAFTVTAAGDGLTYQWEYSDDGGATWIVSKNTEPVATCKVTTVRNGRLYRCTVTDKYGKSAVSESAKLLCWKTLAITSQPADASGAAGDTARFAVKADGFGLSYQWQYSDNGGRTWKDSSSTSASVTCKFTAARDGRLYRCIVTDQFGRTVTTRAAKLDFRSETFAITVQPKSCICAVGETAVFTVKATGTDLTWQWQYSDNNGQTWKNSSATTDTATCKITAARDGRLYRCVVTDGSGQTITSSGARIIVE